MMRPGILIVALLSFFSGSIFAAIDDKAENNNLLEKFSQAQNLVSQGKTKQAIEIYESIISLYPETPEAYNNLASLYLKDKNTKKAKLILEQGLLAHKGYAALYQSLSAINISMAKNAYGKALQLDLKPGEVSISPLALNEPVIIVAAKVNTPQNQSSVAQIKHEILLTPTSAPKQIPKTDTKIGGSLKRVLQAWAVAWSAQATDIYLSFYHEQYNPVSGLSRKGWVQSRRLRLKKPKWIKVHLSDFNVVRNNGKQAIVKFKQHYRSNSFSDVSLKRLVLLYTNDGWRIFREKSL